MGIKKFIKKVKQTLGLISYEVEGTKKSLKDLLKKLNNRKKNINKSLKSSLGKKEKKALEEELEIVSLQIKKGKKILHDLYS
jgi:hypothetical protein